VQAEIPVRLPDVKVDASGRPPPRSSPGLGGRWRRAPSRIGSGRWGKS